MDHGYFNSEYFNQTTVHPVGLVALVLLGIATLALPRRWALIPMIIMACTIAPGQRVIIATLDFHMLRLMVMFGWARLLLRSELRGLHWNMLDVLIVAHTLVDLTAGTILTGGTQLVNKLGAAYDMVGMYFLFRFLIREWKDLEPLKTALLILSLPIALAFLFEHFTARNIFSALGGVPEVTVERSGRLRCQGAFAHPILAGCFWAAALPLIALDWWRDGVRRIAAVLGVGMCLLIIVLCASSTPVVAVAVSAIATGMFVLRSHMRWIRWGSLVVLTVLHLVMNAPVWHLIVRVNVVGGSTGWHRYYLIDQAIEHIGEWWLIGSNLGTAHWGRHLFDVTNLYVVQGLHGGVLLLGLFVLTIAVAFRMIGQTRQAAETAGNYYAVRASWALGVILFTHCMNFIAVSYFGQIAMMWALLLATIASVSSRPVHTFRTRMNRVSANAFAKASPSKQWMPASASVASTH